MPNIANYYILQPTYIDNIVQILYFLHVFKLLFYHIFKQDR